MNEKLGEEKQDCKKGLRRGTKSNDIIQVYSLIIGNLIDEIILILLDSNTGSFNSKANALSSDPAKKVPRNSFKFLSKSWISGSRAATTGKAGKVWSLARFGFQYVLIRNKQSKNLG